MPQEKTWHENKYLYTEYKFLKNMYFLMRLAYEGNRQIVPIFGLF